MIISRTPLRISFAGGGSDIPSYYKSSAGTVVSSAIDKYIYIAVNKKFDNKIRASYSKTEIVSKVSQIKHDYIRECLKFVGIKGGIEITSISDIPSEGTGLGSSSSYLVGLLNACYAYTGKYISAERLAYEACKIELEIIGKRIGKQDQYIAAFGGLQRFDFLPNGDVVNTPIICSTKTKELLSSRLLLFYTGITGSSSKVLDKQIDNLESDKKKFSQMEKMVNLAKNMSDSLQRNELKNFGEILNENWMLKKNMASGISNRMIDNWYNKALKHGAEGGKLLGAGGRGFLLIYAKSKFHQQIKEALSDIRCIDFSFHNQGSKIIFVSD